MQTQTHSSIHSCTREYLAHALTRPSITIDPYVRTYSLTHSLVLPTGVPTYFREATDRRRLRARAARVLRRRLLLSARDARARAGNPNPNANRNASPNANPNPNPNHPP